MSAPSKIAAGGYLELAERHRVVVRMLGVPDLRPGNPVGQELDGGRHQLPIHQHRPSSSALTAGTDNPQGTAQFPLADNPLQAAVGKLAPYQARTSASVLIFQRGVAMTIWSARRTESGSCPTW
jgi:hypothetical protein